MATTEVAAMMGPGLLELDEAERIKRRLYRRDATQLARIAATCPAALSEDDLAFYRTEGYLAVEGLLSAEEVEACTAALSDLLHGRVEGKVGRQEEPYYREGKIDERVSDPELTVRKLWSFCKVEPRLERMAGHPRLVPLLDQLIEPGHRLVQDMALIKPPFHGSEKPWHQDTAYFDWTLLGGIIGVWIALDPATIDNGCMQVIPGSHLDGPTPHFHVRDCQMADDRVRVDRAVVVPLQPGGALFFSGLLHHGTPPNLSGDRRRALQFHYAAAACRNMTIQEHAELFNEGGAYAGCRKLDPDSGLTQAVYSP
ncbi:MAG TPA: phytanoyl-CoA dioxygenase family protein [Chloroflexota bacterium]